MAPGAGGWGLRPLPLLLPLLLGAVLLVLGPDGIRERRGPIAVPDPAAEPPELTDRGGIRQVVTRHPAERLVLDTSPPRDTVRLLWLGGRTASPGASAALVLDGSGGLLSVDPRLRVHRLAAALGERELLSAAAAPGGGWWVTDAGGELIRLGPDGKVVESVRTAFSYPHVASDAGGRAWLVRSPHRFAYRWDSAGSPLLIRLGRSGAQQHLVGRALVPDHVLLQELANAGSVAVRGDTLYYAPFIRDQVIALSGSGETLWVASRGLPGHAGQPRFEVAGRRVLIDYHPINLGLVIGPDDRLYVLSTTGGSTTEGRLDIFDRQTGVLLRSTPLPTTQPSLAVDRSGRVYLLDERALLTGLGPRRRERLEPFDLEQRGGGRISLAELRGRVVLVNFWATWCPPCVRELPALDRLDREIADSGFVLLAVNEDVDTAALPGFLQRVRIAAPVLLGGGRMKLRYHYPGLPYTMLLDREGRVVQRWAGELDESRLAALRTAIEAELRLGAPGPIGHHAGGG